MHVTIITAFPGFFKDFLTTSIVGRAVSRGLITVDIVDLRQFGRGGYHQIDDAAFGSGGQILAAPVMKDALTSLMSAKSVKPFVVYPSPQGVMLTQEIIETLSLQEHVVILCGHYEGIDERFVEREVNLEVTVGDCVLTGGEIPAMTIVDAMSRLVPDVVGREGAVQDDSFYRGMLDHPHYTRPASWEGVDVPQVLLSGNDSEVKSWRRTQAIERTLTRRPDLLEQAVISDYLAVGARLAVGSHNIPTRDCLETICLLCQMYSLGRPFLVITNPEQRKACTGNTILEGLNPAPKVLGSTRRVLEQLSHGNKANGIEPLVIEIVQQACAGAMHWRLAKRQCLEAKGPVLLLVQEQESGEEFEPETGKNEYNGAQIIRTFLTGEVLDSKNSNINNNLPLSVKVAIALDRLMGRR